LNPTPDAGRAVDVPASSALVAARYALLFLSCATGLIYFQWRLGVMNPAFALYSWIVYAAELIGFARTLMFLVSAVRVPHREAPPLPAAGLIVDVLIPTLDEPLDVVRRTVLAALAIRYPHETWLLDDGGRPEMRQLAEETGCRYVARTEHVDAKAGNLNHALTLANGAFVTIFDADHVANPRFLDRTLGYFDDDRLAFVQTPQAFYNIESFEHLSPKRTRSNGGSFFHHVVQRSRDASNATIFSGSAAVFRRQALDDVSGFATGTISEDVHTSLRLHAAGWQSIFHSEILSAGMAPLDGAGFRGQRLRWAQAALQLLLRENVAAHRGLTSGQRLAYLMHIANNMEGWRHLFIYTLPIAILVTGILPAQTSAASFLAHFVPYFVATNVAIGEFARGHARPDESAVYNLARCPAAIVGLFTAPLQRSFRVTPKVRGHRSRFPESAFTDAVLLLTLGAIIFAAGEAAAGRSPLAASALAVVVAWASYHVFTAMRLLMLEHRCARDRRAGPRFEESLPATIERIDDIQSRYTVEVVVASAGGFTLRALDERSPLPAGAYRGILNVDGTHLAFELSLREGGRGGAVRWPDSTARTTFDGLLHLRAIGRFSSADRGDRGGVLRPA
jgi:cellulose synthase (UDP-forming)